MNDIEREAIILNNAWNMIDELVNWSIFEKTDATELSTLWFPDTPNRTVFLILLADFLSQVKGFGSNPAPLGLMQPNRNAKPSDLTYLFHLRQVCDNPTLGSDTSGLTVAVEAFADWLEHEFLATGVNLHNLDTPVDINVSRLQYIRICGDIAKHSIPRLEGNVKRLQVLLEVAGHPIDVSQAYLAFPSFFEWFNNIFIYHATQIAEFLNNIRWEIYGYLRAEFYRSYHRHPKWSEAYPIYEFDVPADLQNPVACALYWDLMNHVRTPPYVQRFVVPARSKTEY